MPEFMCILLEYATIYTETIYTTTYTTYTPQKPHIITNQTCATALGKTCLEF